MEHLLDEDLVELTTKDIAIKLLLKYGSVDVVNSTNDSGRFVTMLQRFPSEIIEAIGDKILERVDSQFLGKGDYLTYHENYREFWECVCETLAPKIPIVMAGYAQGTLLPRLQETCKDEEDTNAQLAVIMLFDIHRANPACVKSIAVEVLAAGNALHGGWKEFANGYLTGIGNVRPMVDELRDFCSNMSAPPADEEETTRKHKRAKTSK